MRTYRAYLPDLQTSPGREVELDDDEAKHLSQVLRVRVGAIVEVLDGRGGLARAEVLVAARSKVRLAIRERLATAEPPARRLELASALTRTDAYDDLLHRAVELGLTGWFPLETDHAVVEFDDSKAAKKAERWGRIAAEALKQCERRWMPEIALPSGLQTQLDACAAAGTQAVALVERAPEAPPLSDMRGKLAGKDLRLFVGPEGGWSESERETLARRALCASLGEGILRAETASLAALALVSL